MLIFNAAGFGNPAEQVPLNGGRINCDNRLLGWPFWAQPFLPIVTIYALLILLLFFGELRRAKRKPRLPLRNDGTMYFKFTKGLD